METLAEAEGQLVKLQRKAALATLVQDMQEVVADKGYHSDDVLVGLEEVGLRSLRLGARSRPAPLARDKHRPSGRSTPIVVEPAASVVSVYSACAANASSAPSLTCTRPAACAGRTCAATRTSSNGC